MAIEVTCKCGKQYRLKDDVLGKHVLCRVCGEELPVPRDIPVAEVVEAPAAAKPAVARRRKGSKPISVALIVLLNVAAIGGILYMLSRLDVFHKTQSGEGSAATVAPIQNSAAPSSATATATASLPTSTPTVSNNTPTVPNKFFKNVLPEGATPPKATAVPVKPIPPPAPRSPPRPTVTLAQLSLLKPPCGPPAPPSTGKSLASAPPPARQLSTEQRDAWFAVMEKLGAPLYRWDKACFSFALRSKMGALYPGEKFDDALNQRLLQRLQTVPPAEFRDWVQAAYKALGSQTSDYTFAMTLASVDSFYDASGKYKGWTKCYSERLAGLPRDAVDRWMNRIPAFQGCPEDAAMAIVMTDAFFEDGTKFDDAAFTKALESK